MTVLGGWRYCYEVVREAAVTARTQPVGSTAVALVVGALCATVLLTTGRAVGAEQEVLASIDSAATRSLVVRATPEAGVDTRILNELARIDGIAWAGAFSPATDVRNSAFPGGVAVPLRTIWTRDMARLAIETDDALPPARAYASTPALRMLGMTTGGVIDASGGQHAVVGELTVPDDLLPLEPLMVVPAGMPELDESVGILVVVARDAQLVELIRATLVSLLAVSDPNDVTISAGEDLVLLRNLVAGQLRTYSSGLVASVLIVALVLIAAVQTGVVLLRRKDYGRVRALGASRTLVILLIVLQSAILAVLGVLLGMLIAVSMLLGSGDPLPGPDFFAAVAVLTAGVGVLAAMLPAAVAARRDPLVELRVP